MVPFLEAYFFTPKKGTSKFQKSDHLTGMTGIHQSIGIDFKSDISRKSYGHGFFYVSTPFLLVVDTRVSVS